MSVINGYYCADCSDELLAKRGIDPAEGPVVARLGTGAEGAARGERPLGVNAPTSGEEVGSRLDLYA